MKFLEMGKKNFRCERSQVVSCLKFLSQNCFDSLELTIKCGAFIFKLRSLDKKVAFIYFSFNYFRTSSVVSNTA